MQLEMQQLATAIVDKQQKNRQTDQPGTSPHAVSAAPMASAPLRYRADGGVDWGNMWDTFCALALDGGPPHRGSMLEAPLNPDVDSVAYQHAAAEIRRGIAEVSGLQAEMGEPGWLRVPCSSAAEASWLAEAILGENVAACHEGAYLFLPVGEGFTVKGEIKNVITAVAKTTHYWNDHLAAEVKQTLAAQEAISQVAARFSARFRKLFRL